jgi:hypothetical protein
MANNDQDDTQLDHHNERLARVEQEKYTCPFWGMPELDSATVFLDKQGDLRLCRTG